MKRFGKKPSSKLQEFEMLKELVGDTGAWKSWSSQCGFQANSKRSWLFWVKVIAWHLVFWWFLNAKWSHQRVNHYTLKLSKSIYHKVRLHHHDRGLAQALGAFLQLAGLRRDRFCICFCSIQTWTRRLGHFENIWTQPFFEALTSWGTKNQSVSLTWVAAWASMWKPSKVVGCSAMGFPARLASEQIFENMMLAAFRSHSRIAAKIWCLRFDGHKDTEELTDGLCFHADFVPLAIWGKRSLKAVQGPLFGAPKMAKSRRFSGK